MANTAPEDWMRLPFRLAVREFEKAYFAFHMREIQSQKRLAIEIGMDRSAMARKLEKLGMRGELKKREGKTNV